VLLLKKPLKNLKQKFKKIRHFQAVYDAVFY
jgi:hypothetical protein